MEACSHNMNDPNGQAAGKLLTAETPAPKRGRYDAAVTGSSEKCYNYNQHFVTPQASSAPSEASDTGGDQKDDIRALLLKEAGFDTTAERDNASKKRENYLCWDDFFCGVAVLSSQRSKKPFDACGCCIVDSENRVVGIGYDGLPRNCPDDCIPYASAAKSKTPFLQTQNPYMVHAAVNAVMNKCCADVSGCKMYVQRFPCNECAKIILQAGIKEVIYMKNNQPNRDTYRATRIMFAMANVKSTQYTPTIDFINLDFLSSLAPNTKEAIDCCNHRETSNTPSKSLTANAKDATTISDKERFRDILLKEAGYDPMSTPNSHRTDSLSWDDYFIAMAFLTAKRSKDPNTQVGAVIVHPETKRILAMGYNGFPRGCSDDVLPWARTGGSDLHKKYLYVCHAEVNAILNKGSADVKGATLYVALFPCNECAKIIIQAGIREVVFMSDRYHDTDACRASRIMFQMANVRLRKHIPNFQSLRLDMTSSMEDVKSTSHDNN